MGDLLKSITGGITKFALAWILPSAITIGLVWIFLLPGLVELPLISALDRTAAGGSEPLMVLTNGVTFAFLAVALGSLMAYGSLPLYRVLEGYTLPKPIKQALLRRQVRKWLQLRRTWNRYVRGGRLRRPEDLERLMLYPEKRSEVMPTRLGNALVRMERFGISRYGLDSQTMWYELLGVSEPEIRRNIEEARGGVDTFISWVGHLGLLAVAALFAANDSEIRATALAIAVLALLLMPVAYQGAVSNMKEWANAVKAMVNLGRIRLSRELGLVPAADTLAGEEAMWLAHLWRIEYGHKPTEKAYDHRRVWPRKLLR